MAPARVVRSKDGHRLDGDGPVVATVRELAHVERISDLGRVGQRVVERLAVRPDRSNAPQRIAARHDSGRASSHVEGAFAVRPSTTSSSCAGLSSATIDVHQHLVFVEPVRAKSVSSNPTAATGPMRAGSSINAVP